MIDDNRIVAVIPARAEASLEAEADEHDLEDTGRPGQKSDKQAA